MAAPVNSFVNHRVDVLLMDLCGHGKRGRPLSTTCISSSGNMSIRCMRGRVCVPTALAKRFSGAGVTLVLTAQTSGTSASEDFALPRLERPSTTGSDDISAGLLGVLPAQACARYLQVPMIFAREKKPITMDSGAFEVGGCRLVMASLPATEV